VKLQGLVRDRAEVDTERILEKFSDELIHLGPGKTHETAGFRQGLVAFQVGDLELGYALGVKCVEAVLVEFCHDTEARPLEKEVEVLVVFALLRLVDNSLKICFRRVNKRLEFKFTTALKNFEILSYIAVLRDIVVHTEVYYGSLSDEPS
jgi:hypothetical protein